jgi:predicted esterase
MTLMREALQLLSIPALTLFSPRVLALTHLTRPIATAQRSFARSMTADNANEPKTVRVLALHGSGENHLGFVDRLAPIATALANQNTKIEWLSMNGPIQNGDGYSWWTYEPGERSSTAKEYFGFQDSVAIVLGALEQSKPDLVLAHSQGAILAAALLALNCIPDHPPLGYLLNGVAWPNPYSNQLEALRLDPAPRVMFVSGEKDNINPMAGQERVQKYLHEAGCDVSVFKHAGGHSPPTNDDPSLEAMMAWINNSKEALL